MPLSNRVNPRAATIPQTRPTATRNRKWKPGDNGVIREFNPEFAQQLSEALRWLNDAGSVPTSDGVQAPGQQATNQFEWQPDCHSGEWAAIALGFADLRADPQRLQMKSSSALPASLPARCREN